MRVVIERSCGFCDEPGQLPVAPRSWLQLADGRWVCPRHRITLEVLEGEQRLLVDGAEVDRGAVEASRE